MCLAIPAKVVQKMLHEAVADLHGNRVTVNTVLTPEVEVGDWILVHAGFAIQRMAEEDAQATWAILRDIAALSEDEAARTPGGPP
jgi:hydrogenase expression/formation protein HypC